MRLPDPKIHRIGDRFLIFHALLDDPNHVTLSCSILIDETFVSIREKRYKSSDAMKKTNMAYPLTNSAS
jgi:hypothetical protein